MLEDKRRQAIVLGASALSALSVTLVQVALHTQIDAERMFEVLLLIAIFGSSMLPLMMAEAYFETMPRALVRRSTAISAAGNMLLWILPGELSAFAIACVIVAQLLSCAIYYEAGGYVLTPPEPSITI